MRIGILGSGVVGQALAQGLVKHGHETMIGTRDPKKLSDFAKAAKVSIGSFADAAKFGDMVIVAVSGAGVESAIDLAGVANFGDKLILDTTNPLDFSKGMPPGLSLGTTDSLGERVQRKLPRAKVVKCFNTVSSTDMIGPKLKEPVPMMVCGNDAAAKKQVETLLKTLGWPGILDVGDIAGARWLEALVPLWVRVGVSMELMGKGSWAFKVVTS